MRRFRIGRAETNDIVLRRPTVSREHAELTKLNRGSFLLKDLASSYGTSVLTGSDWKLITAERVDYNTPVRIGEYETTVAKLLIDLDPLAVYMDSPAIAPWDMPEPRLSPAEREQHPGTIDVSVPMPAGPVAPRDFQIAPPVAAADPPPARMAATPRRVLMSIMAGFAVYLTAAFVTLLVTLAR